MQRPPDLNERLARIGEEMATREDVAELRQFTEIGQSVVTIGCAQASRHA